MGQCRLSLATPVWSDLEPYQCLPVKFPEIGKAHSLRMCQLMTRFAARSAAQEHRQFNRVSTITNFLVPERDRFTL